MRQSYIKFTNSTPLAWKIFAVYIAAILGLILSPAGEAVVMLSVIAFGSFIVPIGQLLSGYGNGTVWLVFTAFLITQAFADMLRLHQIRSHL